MKPLASLDVHLKNRAAELEELKDQGRKNIGYYPGGYVPEEIILACDAVPVTFPSYDAYTEMLDNGGTTIAEKSARTELSRGLYHSSSAILYWTKRAVEDYDLDGILWSQPIHCRPMASSGFILKKALEKEMKIPVLILEVDWYDNRILSGETMRTKIETFGHLLAARKAKKRIQASS
jgi:benzoyl-CoA reductase/2-hydroxyglutaryl-CoA dehydratase subunit BcrC/BadD/HgdB